MGTIDDSLAVLALLTNNSVSLIDLVSLLGNLTGDVDEDNYDDALDFSNYDFNVRHKRYVYPCPGLTSKMEELELKLDSDVFHPDVGALANDITEILEPDCK